MNWERIVIHHTDSIDKEFLNAPGIRRIHMVDRGWSDVGYHWLIEIVEGEWIATMGRPMYRNGAHVKNHNTGSIGVAIIGDFEHEAPPVESVHLCAELCAALCRAQGIRTAEIYGHGDLRATKCPGMVPTGEIRRLVGHLRSGRYHRATDIP